jgi:hypothetical protein
MSDKKISQLPASTTPLAGTEELALVQSGSTKKVSVANLTDGRPVSMSNLSYTGTLTGSTGVINIGSGQIYKAAGGNVGVATTSPANPLTVFRTATSSVNGALLLDGNLGYAGVQFAVSGNLRGSLSVDNSSAYLTHLGNLSFRTGSGDNAGGTDRMVITSAGNVSINTGNLVIGTAGKGIDFSATPGTGTSELLDDYEIGTWTPVLGSDAGESGQTYTEQNGFYQKIGNRVYFQFRVELSAKGTVNLESSLKGLPFNVSFLPAFGCGTVTDFRNLALTYTSLGLMADANNPKMYFRALTVAATSTAFAQANSLYTDTTLMQGFGYYVTT